MKRRTFILVIAVIVLLGIALRGMAVGRLPADFDEPVYAEAALAYAAAIRAGDLSLLAGDPTPEHPGLVKLLYAAVFLRSPPLPDDIPQGDTPAETAAFDAWAADPANRPWLEQLNAMFLGARRASALFGALNVLLVAVVSPAAGALLAVHTYTVKYTAQVYLEALPMFTATVAVLAYVRALVVYPLSSSPPLPGSRSRLLLWWLLSAVALGLTAAGKYVYAVAGVAIAVDYVWRVAAGRRWRELAVLLGWGGVALLVFFAVNPYLWADPAGRLADSVLFHAAYSQGEHVAQSGYPWWQPFVWLFTAQPVGWHPGVIVTPLDGLTAVLGVIGVPFMRRKWRVMVLWWGLGLLFLLAWSTKWPQYSLIMTVPMCLCAAEGLRGLWARIPAELKASA